MTQRVILTLHLPLDMFAVAAVLRAIAKGYPDATVTDGSADGLMRVSADDDISLAERRKIARERKA